MVLSAALSALLCLPAAAQQSAPKPFTRKEIRAAKENPKRFTIDEKSIKLEDLGPVVAPAESPKEPPAPSEDGLDLGTIVNIGLKVWQIIKDNQPVSDIRGLYATALPSGATRWDSLVGWKPPTGRIYLLTAKNLYGTETIRCKFQVLRSWNGSVNGKGRYLTGATVQALEAKVDWGYQFYFDVEVPDSGIINVGDAENPVAGMTINARWKIHTVLRDAQGRGSYWLDGNGAFREIGLPGAAARVAAAVPKMLESLE